MIISKTPYRISLFGGGTDLPEWYLENGGIVLSSSIDKYLYIAFRKLHPYFDFKSRVTYSKIEEVNSNNQIKHPSVKACLNLMKIKDGIDIHYYADLPARSGMASSSAFTVGLLNALYAYKKKKISKKNLSLKAIHVEQNILKEHVGSQDQVIVSHGGMNIINFNTNGKFTISKLNISKQKLKKLNKKFMLFFTGVTRISPEIIKTYKIKKLHHQLNETMDITRNAINILKSHKSLDEIGLLMNKAWSIKKTFSSKVSNSDIDDLYNLGIKSGALGGKILGSGGGGFILFYVPEHLQKNFLLKLRKLTFIKANFENIGSSIILNK